MKTSSVIERPPREFRPSFAVLNSCLDLILLNSSIRTVGLLAPLDSSAYAIYRSYFRDVAGIELLCCDGWGAEALRAALHNPVYGILSRPEPVTEKARALVVAEASRLHERGALAVLLGRPELSEAVSGGAFDFPILDPWLLSSRALSRSIVTRKADAIAS